MNRQNPIAHACRQCRPLPRLTDGLPLPSFNYGNKRGRYQASVQDVFYYLKYRRASKSFQQLSRDKRKRQMHTLNIYAKNFVYKTNQSLSCGEGESTLANMHNSNISSTNDRLALFPSTPRQAGTAVKHQLRRDLFCVRRSTVDGSCGMIQCDACHK